MKLFSKPIPRYVGITDFTTRAQGEKMKQTLAESTAGMKRPPILMVGLMMSFKTLWNIPGKWTPIFPPKERIDEIFPDYDSGTLNALHYADFEDHSGWPKEQDLFHSLSHAMEYARQNLHAIQLDMTWPDPGAIFTAIEASRRQIQVILQIGRKAFEVAWHKPTIVARMLEDYTEVLDGVLLDHSMGEGKIMSTSFLSPYVKAIAEAHPQLHIAVAGGLRHDTIEALIPLLEKFPNLSIDAQGGLRESRNSMNPIDWHLAQAYLTRAGTVFTEYER